MDIIITKPIKVSDLIKELETSFHPDDIVTTGLWIKQVKEKHQDG